MQGVDVPPAFRRTTGAHCLARHARTPTPSRRRVVYIVGGRFEDQMPPPTSHQLAFTALATDEWWIGRRRHHALSEHAARIDRLVFEPIPSFRCGCVSNGS
jgi:hypothetical protein